MLKNIFSKNKPGIYSKNNKLIYTWKQLKQKYGYSIYSDKFSKLIFLPNFPEVTKIILPEMKYLQQGTFQNCGKIVEIILPNGLIGIENDVFRYCCNLKHITIPNTVQYIGMSCFDNCTELESIELSNGLSEIPYGCFVNCKKLKKIKIPDSVWNIQDHAFAHCEKLESVKLSKTLQKIGANVFIYCGITNISMPDTIKKIGENCFLSCIHLKKLKLSENLYAIPSNCFENCRIEELYIPQAIGIIHKDAFAKNPLLSIKVDEKNDFFNSKNNCNAIISSSNTLLVGCKNTKIPEDVRCIAEHAFCGINDLYEIILSENIVELENHAFYDCKNLKKVTFNNNLNKIGLNQFSNSLIETIFIPESVTKISLGAFANCNNLKKIIVDEKNKYYKSIDGMLLNADGTALICYPNGKQDKQYKFDDNIKYITSSSFSQNPYIEILDLNNCIKIGYFCFCNCRKLKIVKMNKIEIISDSSFEKDCQLECIKISKVLTSVGGNTFKDCNRLKTILFIGTPYDFTLIENINYALKKLNLNITDIIYIKTLNELLQEGKTLHEANKILKSYELE